MSQPKRLYKLGLPTWFTFTCLAWYYKKTGK